MRPLAAGLDYLDLNFLGYPQIIATAILHGPGGVALVDPGPASTLPALERGLEAKGIGLADVTAIVLTHIHLDHAGATGTLVRKLPRATVYVHARGARHLVDPARLLDSALRLYGAEMDRLWGEFLAVPAGNVRALDGGETVVAGSRTLEVAYTPGHASHHVCYLDRASGLAFTGDTAGIRRGSGSYVMPPTPPPDIDLEAWGASLDRLLAWDPETLFVTHFGPWQGARPHLEELRERLADWGRRARALLLRDDLDAAGRSADFERQIVADLSRAMPRAEVEFYQRAGRIDYSWLGLERYWQKRLMSGR
jgi:glyoxylase-like metal-dependent hydrolase (beta-lactamase superfamily II)